MRNILAENLLRFGVKNLSEAQKQRLTEAVIDLIKHPGVKKANAYFSTAWDNRVELPTYIIGHYYLMPYGPIDYEKNMKIQGRVITLMSKPIGTETSLPVLPSKLSNEGGGFTWEFTNPERVITKLNWDDSLVQPMIKYTGKQLADTINERFNQMPLKDIQTIYNVHPEKAKMDQEIAAFKSSDAFPWKSMLTGNAKAFYSV